MTTVLAVTGAIAAAVDFLTDGQADDGTWTDWDLAPGCSDAWTTAYVGRQLVGAAPAAALRAADWLVTHQVDGGGWGYNSLVGADADSTALAIDLLAHTGAVVPQPCRERLTHFRQPNGGFSTYPADEGLGSWCISHIDVSATVGHVLPTSDGLVEFVLARRRADGLWNSFWWCTPLYATRACLSLLRLLNLPIDLPEGLRSLSPASVFESALVLDCAVLVGDDGLAARTCRSLVEAQQEDGSWASAPMLRLTDRECDRPWEVPSAGPIYADPHRLFTTATALRALSGHARLATS